MNVYGLVSIKEREVLTEQPCNKPSITTTRYLIPVRHFVNLAQTVAESEKPRVVVRRSVYTLLSDVISLRKMVSEMRKGDIGPGSFADDDSHLHFIKVLERSRDILKQSVERVSVHNKEPTACVPPPSQGPEQYI